MSWRKAVINNAFYVFPPTEVKTFPQVELNRQYFIIYAINGKEANFSSIRQTPVFRIDI